MQVSQALPFLDFASAQWEMIVAVRNLFHEDLLDASVYDELQVVRPPSTCSAASPSAFKAPFRGSAASIRLDGVFRALDPDRF